MSRPVLHIAPTPFFANRGCHIRILNEVRSLQRAGRQVIVCTYGLGNDVDGVDVRRIMSIPGYRKTSAGFSPYRFLADFLLFFLVLKTALKERPVVLHGHLHEGGGIGWLVGRLLFWRRMQVVMDVQGSLSGELEAYGHFRRFPFIRRFFYRAERLICRLPDHLFCSSPASRDFLISHCAVSPEKITLLEDVVPDSFFQVPERPLARQKKGIPDGKDVVIYTGSLLAGKGIDLLLPAVAELAVVRPEWFFVFLGYPVEWLQREVAVRGLEQQVHIVGEVPYLELADWLAVADIAVEPKGSGSGEASGKLLHYMAGRLPVVCFDLPNNR
ncbi:MAG: hypothetical protein CR981_02265, partial [Proteobacteria bacterium]